MNLNNVDISKLPADVRKTFKKLQVMHAEKQIQTKARDDFMSFVKCVWPDFVEGSHHRHIADKFNKLVSTDFNSQKIRLSIENQISYDSKKQQGLMEILFEEWSGLLKVVP